MPIIERFVTKSNDELDDDQINRLENAMFDIGLELPTNAPIIAKNFLERMYIRNRTNLDYVEVIDALYGLGLSKQDNATFMLGYMIKTFMMEIKERVAEEE